MTLLAESAGAALRLLLEGNRYVLETVLLSLRVSGLALLLGTAIGLPVGAALGMTRFRGRSLLVALVHTGFALPPVVVGLFVYMMLSRSGPAGSLEILFTPAAMVIAQAILAAPYIAGISLAAIQAVPVEVRLQALALGASPARAVFTHLREARLGIGAAVVGGFGAVISEVGAVMMVGGNIAGETRVMTTAIMLETRRGNFATAMALGIILLLLAFLVNAILTAAQQGRGAVAAAGRRAW
ncbi:MAG TPA: ABC transporter permease [Longimicrobiales bacterium]|nr:ABC transporter permease [Longimicrobiales bacterium]